ncbi:hypothetical protein BGZ96_001308 [Linnemannia gamsii]|uniref:Uncharacterized protein n=1 Tax=Linnemannia gamsii TaxID=64522 RepID=A0ABQ7KA43_9FUNG|nr:hypothetical protein BGZ96_001308 [Linnemannia gamsii]
MGPLQSLDLFRNVMRKILETMVSKSAISRQSTARENHLYSHVQDNVQLNTPFPGPLEDCLAAYSALIKEYGIDLKRIVFGVPIYTALQQ